MNACCWRRRGRAAWLPACDSRNPDDAARQSAQSGCRPAQTSAPARRRPTACCVAIGANPIAQGGLLLGGETAAAAFMAEAIQPLDPASLISAMPVANRVVIQQQSGCNPLAAPPLVEKDDGVGSAGYAVLRKSVPRNANQGSPIVAREKSAANPIASRFPFNHTAKPFLGSSRIRGRSCPPYADHG